MRSSVSRLSLWLLLTPFLLWIVLLVILPHLQMLRVSFQVRESWDTIAWYIARLARGCSKGILFLACLIPFWASELVRTYGWMILLRESGLFSSWLKALGWVDGPVEMLHNDVAVIIGLVYNGLLFMAVPLVTTLDGMDENLVEAGYDLGGGHGTVLREIVVPWGVLMPCCLNGYSFGARKSCTCSCCCRW